MYVDRNKYRLETWKYHNIAVPNKWNSDFPTRTRHSLVGTYSPNYT